MRANRGLRFFFFISLVLLSVNHAISQAGRGTARVSGLVVDENQNPVSSAKIVMQLKDSEDIKREATSNKKGEWAILGLGTGMWRVSASAEGYALSFVDVYIRQLEANPKITLTLKKMTKFENAAGHEESYFSLFEKANQLVEEQKYDEAILHYRQLLEKNPDAYQVHWTIGNCYVSKGDIDRAIEEYNILLEKSKNDASRGNEMAAKALAGLGECYLKNGDFETAQDYFRQSIDSYPENEIIAYNVGEIYFSNQRVDEAIHYFKISSEIKADWPLPYLKLGYAFLNKGEYDKAILYLKKFLELDPQSPESLTIRNTIEYLEKIKK